VHGLGSMTFGPVVQKFLNIENVVTLEGLRFNSSMISFHIWLFKKSIHTLQNNVHMLSSLFCNGFTLGPTAQVTLLRTNCQ
jgi:hypothetical protein